MGGPVTGRANGEPGYAKGHGSSAYALKGGWLRYSDPLSTLVRQESLEKEDLNSETF